MFKTVLNLVRPTVRAAPASRSPRHATLGLGDFRRLLSEHINDGVVVQDCQGHILWVNQAYRRITGYSDAEVLGRKPQEFILPLDQQISPSEIAAFRYDPSNTFFHGFEIVQNRRKSGELFWAQLSFGFFRTDEGDRVIVTVRDVSEQVAAETALAQSKADLEKAVNYDALTGLANRRKLMAFLGENLTRAAHAGSKLGLLHLDLDRFKEINDTHGHAAGDAVIQYAAAGMQARSGTQGMAARIGGDEFIMVRPDLSEPGALALLADQLIEDTQTPVTWDGRALAFGYSIGMALAEPATLGAQELIQNADFALYEAKARGRGCWAMYDTDLRKRHRARKGMAEDLVAALRAKGIDFHFQPIVDLTTGQPAGIETLARWHHPRKGSIPPVEFLSLASELGVLDQLDMAAMKAAALTQRRITELGFSDTYVSFNASTHALAGAELLEDMLWTTAELEVDPNRLAVEVLETVFFASDATETEVAAQIRQLRAAGFATLLDDFGVGYAGLAHLGQLDVNGLKIDRSLVRNIKERRTDAVIVRAILRLAQDLGLKVVAEGVEDAGMAQVLRQSGCRLAQGYHIARPMPLDALEAWLLRHSDAVPQSSSA